MIRRFLRTPELNDEALNFGEMMQVAVGGHFLDSNHTVTGCRDQFVPHIFQRKGRDDYEASNRRGAFEEARDDALKAIANASNEEILDEAQRTEIAALTTAADRHIVEVYSGNVEMI